MLNDKLSKKFWRQVASMDLDKLNTRMQGQDQSIPPVSLARFAAHFDKIAQPPSCEWFDHTLMQQMKEAVRVTLEDSEVKDNRDGDTINTIIRSVHQNDEQDQILSQKARDFIHRPIDLQDLYEGKERMNKGRASGIDGIPIECVLGMRGVDIDNPKCLVSPLDEAILDLFNIVLESGVFPDTWRRAVL